VDAIALLALASRLLLAGVFAVSGSSKLLDRRGARQGITEFGVPARLAPSAAVALPIVELAIAVALLATPLTWWSALVAAVLLAAFTAAIARNLVLGRRPDCRCFGQIAAGPISRGTLVRNGVFLALAALVIAGGPDRAAPDVYALLLSATASEPLAVVIGAVLLVALVVQTRFLGQLLAQNGRLILRLEELERSATGHVAAPPPQPTVGLPVGTRAPEFSLAGLHGETLTLASLTAAGLPVLLVLGDPGCGPCNAMLPDVGRWQREHAGRLTVAVVTRGTRVANRSKAAEHGLGRVLLQKDRELADSYKAPATPSAVVVSPDGLIASPVAEGAPAIAALVARTAGVDLAGQAHDHGPPVTLGQAAPAVRLPDLDGRVFELASLRGERVLVLFWDPGCGFCSQLLDDVRAWEAHPPSGAPRLVVVSAGGVEANRALGFRSTVVIDGSFAVGHAFGATGTPSAILVDASGVIASTVAAGGPAVLALATQPSGAADRSRD
jgi:peroxiredoxin/uncharacterized membrane protein YphA (DoxX/SURF4 family)